MNISREHSQTRKTQILKVISGAALLVVAGTLAVLNYKQPKLTENVSLADFTPQVPYGQAVFWTDPGYKGNKLDMQVDGFNEARLWEMGWNDEVSSF